MTNIDEISDSILSDYLTYLRNLGLYYDYIDGFEEGFNTSEDIDEEKLRNNGFSYNYIDGFKEGNLTSLYDICIEIISNNIDIYDDINILKKYIKEKNDTN